MAAAVLGPTLTSSGKPWEAAPGRRPGGLRGHPDRPRRPHNGQGDTGGLRVWPVGVWGTAETRRRWGLLREGHH